jgi:hypothetical protein
MASVEIERSRVRIERTTVPADQGVEPGPVIVAARVNGWHRIPIRRVSSREGTIGLAHQRGSGHDVIVSPTITVYRSPDIWVDRNRLYKVIIDDQEMGELWPGQRLSLDVPSGGRRIVVKIDLMRSNELALAVGPGDVIDLTCSGRGSPMAFFNSVFRRKVYLDLHVMTHAERTAAEMAQPQAPTPRNLGDEGAP